MYQGKNKAITFSYDDGVTQDRRLIEILNRYGLKATFNINSGLLDRPDDFLMIDGKKIGHAKVSAAEVRRLYQGHEVAVHTLTHPNLTELDEAGDRSPSGGGPEKLECACRLRGHRHGLSMRWRQ